MFSVTSWQFEVWGWLLVHLCSRVLALLVEAERSSEQGAKVLAREMCESRDLRELRANWQSHQNICTGANGAPVRFAAIAQNLPSPRSTGGEGSQEEGMFWIAIVQVGTVYLRMILL